jgi:hypothetical protein
MGRYLEVRQGKAEIKSSLLASSTAKTVSRFTETISTGLTILFSLVAVLFFVLAVIGTVRNYSPVPWLDMWDDYIGFYLRLHAGDWGAWWAQHNEHRIVLARMFFWVDVACFHGNGIFSLVVIYIFALAVGALFAEIWREQSQGQDLYILFFVEAWIFSWTQKQNLTWAFQSQFILAQLLPLAGLYFFHLSLSRPDKTRMYFSVATVCGLLAVGSMANGILALPAMALYAMIAARSFRQTMFFIALSVAEICLYFHQLEPSHFQGAAPTLLGEILQHPAGFIEFFLTYIGGPFIALLGFKHGAIFVGEFCAAALVLISAAAFFGYLGRAKSSSLPLALLVFILYIMATAAVTAAGRLPLGLQEALSGRYQTPALYGWAAALLLFWPEIAKRLRVRNIFSLSLAVFLLFVMLPTQLRALTYQRPMQFSRAFSALSLELQINDVDQIIPLYPFPDALLNFAYGARQQHLSVFGFAPLKDAHLLLGQKIKTKFPDPCRGSLDIITLLADAPQYVRLQGWLYNARPIKKPEMVILADQTNEIVGLGLLGEQRLDVARVLGNNASYSGFEAYLSAKANGQRISILSPSSGCTLPPLVVRFSSLAPAFPAAP